MIGRAIFAVVGLLAVPGLPWRASGQEPPPAIQAGGHRVPFQARDGLIYIHARVNGTSRMLLVDTGAILTVFTIKAVPTLDVDSAVTIHMAKGSAFASRLPVGLVLGDAEPSEPHCAFRLNAVVGAFKFMNAEGVVGLDVLSRFKSVTFDFKNSVMVLEDR